MHPEIRKIYILNSLTSLDFARGIFALYLVSKGLSESHIGILQSFLFLANMFFEVPSGIVADTFSRKAAMKSGLLFLILFPVLLITCDSVVGVFFCFVILAIGQSLISGSDNALLYESVNRFDDSPNAYKKHIGKIRSLKYTMLGCAIFLGGFMQIYFSWEAVYLSTSLALIIAFYVVSTLKIQEPSMTKKVKKDGWFGFSELRFGKFWYLYVGTASVSGASTPLFIFSQLLFSESGLSSSMISTVIACGLAFSVVAYSNAYKLGEFVNGFVMIALNLFNVLLLTLIPIISNEYSIVLIYLLCQIVPALLTVHFSDYINKSLTDSVRATGNSVESFFSMLFLVVANVIIGVLIELIGIRYAISTLAVFPVFTVVLYIVFLSSNKKHRYEKNKNSS